MALLRARTATARPRAVGAPPMPTARPVRLQELQATIMFLLSLPARCIFHDMRACRPVGVGRAQCCYSNVLATERRLFAEHTLLSPVRVWRAKILPEGCRSLVPARKICSGTRHASKQQGIQHNRLEEAEMRCTGITTCFAEFGQLFSNCATELQTHLML